jgi:hypothetical protein
VNAVDSDRALARDRGDDAVLADLRRDLDRGAERVSENSELPRPARASVRLRCFALLID